MEKLYLNLSEEEFSKGPKSLLGIFASLFLLAAIYVLVLNLALGHKNIPLFVSLITFGISLFVAIIAAFATIKRKDLFFTVNDEIIEFRFGIISPKKHTFKWVDIKEIIMPSKQKKVMLRLTNGSSFLLNLNWLQKRKSSLIRKHIYLRAKEKNIQVTKIRTLLKKSS